MIEIYHGIRLSSIIDGESMLSKPLLLGVRFGVAVHPTILRGMATVYPSPGVGAALLGFGRP